VSTLHSLLIWCSTIIYVSPCIFTVTCLLSVLSHWLTLYCHARSPTCILQSFDDLAVSLAVTYRWSRTSLCHSQHIHLWPQHESIIHLWPRDESIIHSFNYKWAFPTINDVIKSNSYHICSWDILYLLLQCAYSILICPCVVIPIPAAPAPTHGLIILHLISSRIVVYLFFYVL
jgi:hypothetical protein